MKQFGNLTTATEVENLKQILR